RHAADRDSLSERQIGEFVSEVSSAIPNFNGVSEILKRTNVRIGMVNARNQNIASVWRRIGDLEDARLAKRRGFSAGNINESELGSRIVVEKLLVARALEQVFECRSRRRFAETFLDDGAYRDARFGGRPAAIHWN